LSDSKTHVGSGTTIAIGGEVVYPPPRYTGDNPSTQAILTALENHLRTIEASESAKSVVGNAVVRISELNDEIPHAIDKVQSAIDTASKNVDKIRSRAEKRSIDASRLAYAEGVVAGLSAAKLILENQGQ
jgi:hypothetical protein